MPRIERYITKSLNFPNKQDPNVYTKTSETLVASLIVHQSIGVNKMFIMTRFMPRAEVEKCHLNI